MNDEIDLEELKHEEAREEFKSRPFLFPKQIDTKKNVTYAYRVKFREEPRSFTSKQGNTYDVADALLIEIVNDKSKEVEVGKEYTVILHKVLKDKLLKLGNGSITDKTFDFAHRGMRQPTKRGKRPYHDYGVMLKEGTLSWSTLHRVLPITD